MYVSPPADGLIGFAQRKNLASSIKKEKKTECHLLLRFNIRNRGLTLNLSIVSSLCSSKRKYEHRLLGFDYKIGNLYPIESTSA